METNSSHTTNMHVSIAAFDLFRQNSITLALIDAIKNFNRINDTKIVIEINVKDDNNQYIKVSLCKD